MPSANINKSKGVRQLGRLGVLIPGVILCVFFLASILAILISRQTAYTQTLVAVNKQLENRITFIQGAAEEFLEMGLRARLPQLISSLAADNDLISIHIVDENNQVLASSKLADIGLSWQTLQQDFQQPLVETVRRTQRLASYHNVEKNFLDTYAGLCGEIRPDRLRSKACGFISYRVDIKPHMQAATLALRDKSTYYILGMATVVLVSLSLIHVLVTRRTRHIAALVKQFGDGKRSTRITVDRNDEISELGHSINSLLDEIVEDEKAIRDGHERLHALFDNVIDSVIVINEKGLIEQANPATEQIFGYTPEELIGQNVSMLMPEQTRSEHDRYLSNYCETGVKNTIGVGRQVEALHKSGTQFPVELTISEMHVHGERLFTGILRDISEQVVMRQQMEKAYEDLSEAHTRLEQSARTDKLTDLFNRGYFDTALYTETMRATRYDEPLSLMLLDVDYFKPYNDHYGHPEGDRCLQEIAQILKQVFQRSGEVVARYGGEEFAVILPHCDENIAMSRADKLLQAVRDKAIPHVKSGIADHITVSIGVVTCRQSSIEPIAPDKLIKAADEMLYKAKAAGRNQAFNDLLTQNTGNSANSAGLISAPYVFKSR
jgi:diguanylate cyclase (GGDEF)-like protein/PAS domain S-box-containing protein